MHRSSERKGLGPYGRSRVLTSEQAEAGMGVGLQVVQRLRNCIAAACSGKGLVSVCESWPLA